MPAAMPQTVIKLKEQGWEEYKTQSKAGCGEPAEASASLREEGAEFVNDVKKRQWKSQTDAAAWQARPLGQGKEEVGRGLHQGERQGGGRREAGGRTGSLLQGRERRSEWGPYAATWHLQRRCSSGS